MAWTDERIDHLKQMWEKGLTASQIAEELGGVSRNAVIGKAHRLGLKSRPSPVKAKAKTAKGDKPAPKPKKSSGQSDKETQAERRTCRSPRDAATNARCSHTCCATIQNAEA